MGHFSLPVSPPEVFNYRGVSIRTNHDCRGGFNDEYAHSGENTRSPIRLCQRLCRVLAEASGSKLDFGVKNPETDLWLDSSPLAYVRHFPS